MLYSIFELDQTLVGVPISCILEIPKSTTFYNVKGAPTVIDGVINHKGKIVPVLNLGLAFKSAKVQEDEESRIYIFKNNEELSEVADSVHIENFPDDNIGLHVEKIHDVLEIEDSELSPVPSNMRHPFYQHVVRKNDEFIIVLKLSKLLVLNQTLD